MEAVAGAIVGAAAQVVIDKLVSLISLKFNQVEEFSADMKKLKSNFEWVQATLDDAGMQHITSSVVKLWLRNLQDVSDEAFHALDEFHYHLFRERRNSIEAQTTMMKKTVFSGSSSNDPRQKLGRRIKDINEKLEPLISGATNLGIYQMMYGRASNTPGVGAGRFESTETDSFTVDPVFVGRENDVSKIVEVLVNIPTETDSFTVVPVVGMGGLGKTTLAREVYHHGRVTTRFSTRIWVHVSTTFDLNTLFKKILTTLTSEKVEVENREVVLRKLQEALANKTFLLVLDDVWNQDRWMWEAFMNPLFRITSTKGNGIIVTTRNSEVGSIVGTLPIYELQGLSEEVCWSIVKAKAFGEIHIPLDFEIVGRKIAKKCQGLPLAANVVGGLLRGKSKDEWDSIEKKWISDGDENVISKILKLSFHHLSSPSLKKCFAYCSIFEKGHWITRDVFIELWMAEGFLETSGMENVGNTNFNLLLQNSLLQVVGRDAFFNVNFYGMHDLVHDLANSVSKDIYKARYTRWKCNKDASSSIPEEEAKRWHALSYQGPISDIVFSHFKSLHSLTLTSYGINELPDSIRELIHLRCLNISITRIEYLPDSIGELYHLQTFRAQEFIPWKKKCVKKLPSTIKYLFNLRHLHVSDDVELPPHMGMLTSLRTLRHFKLREEEGRRIVELKNLNNLQGELTISNLETVQGLEESEKANLIQKSGIIKLVLRWDEYGRSEINDESSGSEIYYESREGEINYESSGSEIYYESREAEINDESSEGEINDESSEGEINDESNEGEINDESSEGEISDESSEGEINDESSEGEISDESSEGEINDEDVLKGLQPHPNLKMLEIYGFEGTSFPSWTLKMAVCLEGHWVGLDNLTEIKLEDCLVCEEIPMLGHLPHLRSLYLSNLPNVKSIGASFYGIDGCSSINVFPALERLELEYMPNLNEWVEVEISSAGETHESRDVKVFPCLKYLVIWKCKRLRSAPSRFPSLRKLKICEMESGLPLEQICAIQLTTLSKLKIEGLYELVGLPDWLFQNNQNLSSLVIRNCPRLRGLPNGLQTLNSLSELTILNCENLMSIPYSRIDFPCEVGLRKLQRLIIDTLGYSADSSLEKAIYGILRLGSHSLCELHLKGKADLQCLPNELQHLSALKMLRVYGFGMEELPEWIGNLSSLETLDLRSCKKLKSLPSVEAMRRLTNLTCLDIHGSPLLKVIALYNKEEIIELVIKMSGS